MSWLFGHIVGYIEEAAVWVANAVISSLGAFISYIVGLLPSMPGQPSMPAYIGDTVAVMYQVCDVGWLLAYIASFFTLMAAVFLLMIPLRWIKAAD